MTIEIKQLKPGDIGHFEALINVFEEVFGMDHFLLPDQEYLEDLLQREGFMVYVAVFDGQVVGGLTAYILPSYYFQSSEVYIYDLAVSQPFQRKGTGRKLIDTIKADCRAAGLRELFIQVDPTDQHAVDFYLATGGKAEEAIHFSYPL